MTEFRIDEDSGLAVPVEATEQKSTRERGPMELQGDRQRARAKDALQDLANAMELIRGTSGRAGIAVEQDMDAARRQVHGSLLRQLGDLILGDDYFGWEEWT